MLKSALRSPKTTFAGILGLVATAAIALQNQYDGDPSTVPDWGLVVLAVMAAMGFVAARDADKSSQDHAIRPGSRPDNYHRGYSSLLLFPLAAWAALLAGGCAQSDIARVGGRVQSNQTASDIQNPRPNTITGTDGEASVALQSTVPATRTEIRPDEIITITGGVSRELIAPIPGTSQALVLRAGTDIEAQADEITMSKDQALMAKGVRIKTSASEPTRAANEALDRLAAVWQARDAASQATAIEQIRTTGQIPRDLAPTIADLLRAVLVP